MSRIESTGSIDPDYPSSGEWYAKTVPNAKINQGAPAVPGRGSTEESTVPSAEVNRGAFGVTPRGAAREMPIPAVIGKYQVIDQFPPSGQAQVFRVVHLELRRDLVLKLANRPVDDDGRAALVEEGRRLAELDHPSIVRVHDLDFHDGRPYLVMEYIRGRTLAQYAREERVTPRQAAALVAEIVGAVAFAHRRGIVHQDIKPANVLVDETGRPRLIDFGLAWQQDAWSGSGTPSEGGTFAYMAPEQARADVDRVRTLSDVFALGGLLYSLLTGKAPFASATTQRASWERARRYDLDQAALKQPGIPRGLERICLKAMAAEPESRFPSADELRRALERYLLVRRAAPAVGAAAVGLALLVPAWAFWPRLTDRATDKPAAPIAGGGTIEARPTVPAALRVVRFDIRHYPKDDPKQGSLLGVSSFQAREDDDVIVRAELSESAYSYLIAFRPDGTDELCDPEDESAHPVRKLEPSYPPPDKTDERYRLSEGAGLYAFALVVSRQPLPPYREWKQRIGPGPWAAKLPCESGMVWRDDDQGLQVLLADSAAGTRGKGAKARDSGSPATNLASWLRGQQGIDAVTLEAFPVAPAAGR
jgi:hypothetical protein